MRAIAAAVIRRTLIGMVLLRQRGWCHCVSPSSCCNTSLRALREMSLAKALGTMLVRYGEDRESLP